MSTITLTPDQQASQKVFAALLAGGCQSKIGAFKLDASVAGNYVIDPSGTKLLYSAALASVNLQSLNPTIKPALGSTSLPVIASWPLTWDMNGVCQQNPNLSLVAVVPPPAAPTS